MQQQKTSLCGDRRADLIVDHQTATSLETFFGKKYLSVTKQFRAVARGQLGKKYNMTLNQRQPSLRKRPGPKSATPGILQKTKHDRKSETCIVNRSVESSSDRWLSSRIINKFRRGSHEYNLNLASQVCSAAGRRR